MFLVDLSRSVPNFCRCFLGLVPTGAEGEASMFYRATKPEASESGREYVSSVIGNARICSAASLTR